VTVRAYGELLVHRAARWPLLSSTLARLTPGMIVLALVYLLRDGGYSYTAVGAVTAAHQVGVGLGSPWQGRLVDRFGQRAVLVPDAVLYLVGTVAIAAAGAVGCVAARARRRRRGRRGRVPTGHPCSRVLLSGLFPSGRLREAAFALSSIAVELGFILGPLVAVGVRAGIGGRRRGRGRRTHRGRRRARLRGDRRRRRGARAASGPRHGHGALRSGGVRVMVVALGFIAVAFGILDVVVPAVAEFAGRQAAAGALIASIAAGSLLGGLVYGSRVWPGTAVTRLRVLTSRVRGRAARDPAVARVAADLRRRAVRRRAAPRPDDDLRVPADRRPRARGHPDRGAGVDADGGDLRRRGGRERSPAPRSTRGVQRRRSWSVRCASGSARSWSTSGRDQLRHGAARQRRGPGGRRIGRRRRRAASDRR
jgi:hypothetical protein